MQVRQQNSIAARKIREQVKLAVEKELEKVKKRITDTVVEQLDQPAPLSPPVQPEQVWYWSFVLELLQASIQH